MKQYILNLKCIPGACMYSIQAHDGSIQSLAYSASYVLSLGTDDKLCVWERFQGHLLNTISIVSFNLNLSCLFKLMHDF
jgi:WD40 repeat protein